MKKMKLLLALFTGLVALTTSPGSYAMASEPVKATKNSMHKNLTITYCL